MIALYNPIYFEKSERHYISVQPHKSIFKGFEGSIFEGYC